jgi:hypothetical protein
MPFYSDDIALYFLEERVNVTDIRRCRQCPYRPQVQQHMTCQAVEMHDSLDK